MANIEFIYKVGHLESQSRSAEQASQLLAPHAFEAESSIDNDFRAGL